MFKLYVPPETTHGVVGELCCYSTVWRPDLIKDKFVQLGKTFPRRFVLDFAHILASSAIFAHSLDVQEGELKQLASDPQASGSRVIGTKS